MQPAIVCSRLRCFGVRIPFLEVVSQLLLTACSLDTLDFSNRMGPNVSSIVTIMPGVSVRSVSAHPEVRSPAHRLDYWEGWVMCFLTDPMYGINVEIVCLRLVSAGGCIFVGQDSKCPPPSCPIDTALFRRSPATRVADVGGIIVVGS